LCAAAEQTNAAAEGNNRQENFSPLKSDGPHFSFREKSWRAYWPSAARVRPELRPAAHNFPSVRLVPHWALRK